MDGGTRGYPRPAIARHTSVQRSSSGRVQSVREHRRKGSDVHERSSWRPVTALVAVLLCAALSGCGVLGHNGNGRGTAQSSTPTAGSPSPQSSSPQASMTPMTPTTLTTPARPSLALTLSVHKKPYIYNGHYNTKAVLRVHASGYLYEPFGYGEKKPIHYPDPAPMSIVNTLSITWGDGATDGANAGDVKCGKPHAMRRVDGDMKFGPHAYWPGIKSRNFTIGVSASGCGLTKHVKQDMKVFVPRR